VLKAASSMYAHLEGRLQFTKDEGLAGWVARTRRTAYIRERALEDPRVLYVAELEEERFQSLVSVPILARSSEVAGVISVHASAPHEFSHADREFLESTASLVAGAIENARLYEDATNKVAILSELSRLAQRIAAAGTEDELLLLVVDESRRLLNARRCELYLIETEEQLVLAQASPARGGDRTQDLRQLWTSLFDSSKESQAATQVAVEILRSDRADGAPVVAPLVAGNERLGLLAAFLDRPESDARWVLGAVAAHAAVAIKHLRLVDWLRRKNLARDFLEALAKPSSGPDEVAAMAIRLGCNLQAPHLVLAATPRSQLPSLRAKGRDHLPADSLDRDDLLGRLEARLRADVPGCLLDRRGEVLRGLLMVGSAGPDATLEALRKVLREPGLGDPGSLAIGVSDRCQGREELAHGFQEADYAARMGPLMKDEADVSSYPELGAYRYVLASATGVRDGSLERLERLLDYERRRGTELLRTLKVYLDHRGNIARTARAMYMHPNTLRQRLARIEAVADVNLEREDWVSLAMAVRVVELGQLQGATGRVVDDQ